MKPINVVIFIGIALCLIGGGAAVVLANTRGYRNRNPGNVEDNGQPWQGLDNPRNDGRFMRFQKYSDSNPDYYGLRVIARLLTSYSREGIDTVAEEVGRYSETDVSAYIENIAKELGVSQDGHIDFADATVQLHTIRAIVKQENGMNLYSDSQIMEAIQGAAV